MTYEVEAVSDAIANGEKEHPLMRWEESIELAATMDAIRARVGVVYPQALGEGGAES